MTLAHHTRAFPVLDPDDLVEELGLVHDLVVQAIQKT